MYPSNKAPLTDFLASLDDARVAAIAWDSAGSIIGATAQMSAWAKMDGDRISDVLPRLPRNYESLVGRELEVTTDTGHWVGVRVGRRDEYFFAVCTDLEERYSLVEEVNRKTEALEEKVWELSRSKRAILNILEDLEERSRELAKGKDELEVLNDNLQRFNRDLERANRELRGLDEVKSNLLSNVSHELRTPLVAIKGYSELIFREKLGPINEQQRSGLEISLKSLARLIDLINNLLDFSRIEIGRLQLEIGTFNVRELLDEVIGVVKPRADEIGISLLVEGLDDNLQYTGDRNKLAQIFTNLLTNAVKFNREGGTVTVQFEESRERELLFSVIDTGIGIDDEHIAKVFDRFYQVDSGITRKQGGTGIGLSIVKSLVELHGGSIQVFSVTGEGSRFLVRLPYLEDPSLEPAGGSAVGPG